MHRIVTRQASVGSSAWIPVDSNLAPMNIGFGCVVTGTVNYTVQHCFDDLSAGVTANPFPHPFVAAQTASMDGNYAMPITAYRLTVNSGTGSVTMTSLQGNHP